MKGDRELCTAAVTQNGLALEHTSPELKKDMEILQAAFQQMELKTPAEEMRYSRSRWLAAVKQKGQALRAAPEEMKGDRELCTAAVTEDWEALEWASK